MKNKLNIEIVTDSTVIDNLEEIATWLNNDETHIIIRCREIVYPDFEENLFEIWINLKTGSRRLFDYQGEEIDYIEIN